MIQVVDPEINSFEITLDKNYAVLNPLKIFVAEDNVNKKDLILMPHMGKYAKMYFKKYSFFDFDNSELQKTTKNGVIKNLSNKKAKTINRKNIHYLMNDYLFEKGMNGYLTRYFLDNVLDDEKDIERIIVVVDKLNARLVSRNSILKVARLGRCLPYQARV